MEIRLQTGRHSPWTCVCGPHSILKYLIQLPAFSDGKISPQILKCPSSFEKLKTMTPLTPSFQQLKPRGGTCLGIYSNLLKNQSIVHFGTFFLSNKWTKQWHSPWSKMVWCTSISPLLSHHVSLTVAPYHK